MKISMRSWAALTVACSTFAAFGFVACSSSSSGDDSNGTQPVDASVSDSPSIVLDEAAIAAETTACSAYWTAWCTKQATCEGEPASYAQSCITQHTASCPQGIFGGSGATESANDLQTCTNALAAQSCGDFRLGIPAVIACTVPGTRTQNQTCLANAQCKSDYCINYYGCGICAREYDPTEDCTEIVNEPTECAAGTFCDRFGSHHCVQLADVTCDVSKEYSGGCPGASACVTAGDASVGACVEYPDPGHACLYAQTYAGNPYSAYCGSGNCIGADPAARDGGTCVLPVFVAAGDRCGGLADGGTADCPTNTVCASLVNGQPPVCQPSGVANQPCGDVLQAAAFDGGPRDIYYTSCASGFYCSQSCAATSDGGTTGICIAGGYQTGTVGATCDSCTGCISGLQCIDNKCAPVDFSACQ